MYYNLLYSLCQYFFLIRFLRTHSIKAFDKSKTVKIRTLLIYKVVVKYI